MKNAELKVEVTTKANEFIDSFLKPTYIKPHDANEQFNYITNVYGKWYHNYFYFCTWYRHPGPEPDDQAPGFEAKFARMEYVGGNRFNLSFMRHTGQWIELYYDQSLDECLTAIKEDPFFIAG